MGIYVYGACLEPYPSRGGGRWRACDHEGGLEQQDPHTDNIFHIPYALGLNNMIHPLYYLEVITSSSNTTAIKINT